MSFDELLHKLGVLLGVSMIAAGALLSIWLLTHFPAVPNFLAARALAVQPVQIAQQSASQAAPPVSPLASAQSPLTAADSPLFSGAPFTVGLAADLPRPLTDALLRLNIPVIAEDGAEPADIGNASLNRQAALVLSYVEENGAPLFRQVFAVADIFNTLHTTIRWSQVQDAWHGSSGRYSSVAVRADSLAALESILGPAGPAVMAYAGTDEIVQALQRDPAALAFVPFDELTPQLVVYELDGQNPVENDARFDAATYPFVATVYVQPGGAPVPPSTQFNLLEALPATNRDPERLTVVAMTGVTAMVRNTAAQMDQRGSAWPAEVVGPELAQADITAISNEVPFVDDCEADPDPDNLVFCSKPDYLAALLASGADIIGLTGNHLNDFGYAGALNSLDVYTAAGLPVYGGGKDLASALAPLVIEHHGNRLAFLGANSYGPASDWAGEFGPGSAPFDLDIMSAMIRELKTDTSADPAVDVVFAELQYQESDEVEPLADQRLDFRALVRAGADIVTGVQSHVPQQAEFFQDKLILYGLGNFFFDQMREDKTRQSLIVKHTLYAGRHISTQLRPTLLYDYGQPRWATPAERAVILDKVFSGGVFP